MEQGRKGINGFGDKRLSYEKIVHDFNVSRNVAHRVISQLKKDGLVLSKRGVGSFVA